MRIVFAASAFVAILVMTVGHSRASYNPKATPRYYRKEEEIEVTVAKMTSTKTRVQQDYYSLPFCRPEYVMDTEKGLDSSAPQDSSYKFHFLAAQTLLKRQQCLVSCKIGSLSQADATAFKERIEDEYRVHMTLDGLPIATVRVSTKDGVFYKAYDQLGYPIGFKAADATGVEKFFLYNHLRFYVLYYKETYDAELGQIVGFEVEPLSAKHKYELPWNATAPVLSTCNPMTMTFVRPGDTPQPVEEGEEIIFTYDVVWMISDIPWARRWDTYLRNESPRN